MIRTTVLKRVDVAADVRRSGLTLIELLVVVFVISVLVTLLLPAVQQAREAARRAGCASNLRQIGVALHAYHDVYGSLPPAHASAMNASGEYLQQSWTKQLLPFLEQRALFEAWDRSLGFAQGTNRDLLANGIPVFRCPSSPVSGIEEFHLSGYAPADLTDPRGPLFDAGVSDYFAVSEFIGPSRFRYGSGTGMLPHPIKRPRPYRLDDITDGLSHTLAVAECSGGPHVFRAGGHPAGRRQSAAQGHWAGRNRLILRRYDARGERWLGGDCLVNCTNENGANLFGFHSGGVQVLAGDGSCRFLSAATEFETVARLCVVDDGMVIDGY